MTENLPRQGIRSFKDRPAAPVAGHRDALPAAAT